ncbi:MAG: ABC transporter ATP-binding protein [Candidatus Magasanikbacteria bacterium CG10_big_fil_rev_8_21_14_0_10_43_6]|uniref:ABC transporter ATP-binding protein n=1 Tax=Candidatus Magasanikbacteria bacterium CG10_big_fil_rev_8_21_14_0_10_43_6 TaxID=1974650 RepID=A0A2M6W0M2_9BACT|nr:MAG: ABC transporter ATP-binding protein [Candidatus Magasanikbacteria bacterium CG10_big_fil_rev_8_21_14_0_10_43_6]
MSPALDISHFTKKYGALTAVEDLSFSIQPGEFFGFLGKNGAGKTTTISAITGINTIDQGEIRVFGIDAKKDYKEARKKIGLSPQEFNVDIFAPAEKILWYVGGYYGVDRATRKKRMASLFKTLDLEQHKEKPFRALSGGLKRRVMLARALIHDPALLILDEPTAGVDVELRHELWEYLKKINAEGKTILLTSHYLEEVELLCNRIGVIHNGKLIAIDDKQAFIKDGSTLEKTYLELTKK